MSTTQFGKGHTIGGETIAHPIGIALLVICAIAIFKQPRERVVLPMVLFMVSIPSAQRLVIATLDFSFVRILVMVSLARMFMTGESRYFKIQKPDKVLFWWMGFGIITYGILKGGPSGVITRTGYMLDTVGAYYVGRVYIRTTEDIKRLSLAIGAIAIPMLFFFF
ncbi:MAG: hypothetical protein Q9M50_09410 [Methylococcales bacterium]|nr:hypothetical protein [Methylococcales bacterium]